MCPPRFPVEEFGKEANKCLIHGSAIPLLEDYDVSHGTFEMLEVQEVLDFMSAQHFDNYEATLVFVPVDYEEMKRLALHCPIWCLAGNVASDRTQKCCLGVYWNKEGIRSANEKLHVMVVSRKK